MLKNAYFLAKLRYSRERAHQKIANFLHVFDVSGPCEKMLGMAPNGAGSLDICFPANPDLADILGRMDFDFEIFYLLKLFGSQISGLGPA